jgi:hypothetical protein
MVASATARVPKIVAQTAPPEPAATTAPTKVIPLIAFEPDISGVCSVGGTLVITSNPTKIASTKIVRPAISPAIWLSSLNRFVDTMPAGRSVQGRFRRRVGPRLPSASHSPLLKHSTTTIRILKQSIGSSSAVSDVRGQRSKVRGQRSEVRRSEAEVRGLRSVRHRSAAVSSAAGRQRRQSQQIPNPRVDDLPIVRHAGVSDDLVFHVHHQLAVLDHVQSRKRVRLFEYIWLAWNGASLTRFVGPWITTP